MIATWLDGREQDIVSKLTNVHAIEKRPIAIDTRLTTYQISQTYLYSHTIYSHINRESMHPGLIAKGWLTLIPKIIPQRKAQMQCPKILAPMKKHRYKWGTDLIHIKPLFNL